MIKYITTALMLLAITSLRAQNARDTAIQMYVNNTGVRFKLIAADFGRALTQDFVGTMVRSYDTVMVLKANTNADSTGKKPLRYTTERRCDVLSQNVAGKIVVMELNKDCDVSQTCLNAQRAGAIGFVIIHNSNAQGNIKLPKKGLFKDSIRIPIFTVGSNVGDSITWLLPSIVGIKTKTPSIQALAQNKLLLDINAAAQQGKSQITWVNNTGTANDFFVVQKLNRITGVYEDVQIVKTHGVEGYEQYTAYDNNPTDGENTYRIKLVLNDGTVRYSDLKTVIFYSSNGITLYPNPADDLLNIGFKGYTGQDVDITLFDMLGKSIMTQHIEKLPTETQTLDISGKTSAGQYMILIQSKGKRDVVRQFTVGK
jgi:hypothetical protein